MTSEWVIGRKTGGKSRQVNDMTCSSEKNYTMTTYSMVTTQRMKKKYT